MEDLLIPGPDLPLFVYGTLLSGEVHHGLLGSSPLLGPARTTPRFSLVDLGPYPGLVAGGRQAVTGELYRLDEATLGRLDELEEHPVLYRRGVLALVDGSLAQTYLLPRHRAAGCPVISCGDWRLRHLRAPARQPAPGTPRGTWDSGNGTRRP